LGNGLTLPYYLEMIESTRQKLEAYNTALAQISRLYDEAIAAEALLTDLNERMFSGVLTKYGRNSIQYRMVGGKPRGRSRTTKPSAEPPVASEAAIDLMVSAQAAELTSSGKATQNGTRNGSNQKA
jgi:hypothetical protein